MRQHAFNQWVVPIDDVEEASFRSMAVDLVNKLNEEPCDIHVAIVEYYLRMVYEAGR